MMAVYVLLATDRLQGSTILGAYTFRPDAEEQLKEIHPLQFDEVEVIEVPLNEYNLQGWRNE